MSKFNRQHRHADTSAKDNIGIGAPCRFVPYKVQNTAANRRGDKKNESFRLGGGGQVGLLLGAQESGLHLVQPWVGQRRSPA
jgi:hypothetical protein